MVRHGDHGVVAMPDDLEVGDALNSVKPVELKPVFASMKIKDDIMAERSIARSEFVSSSETEDVVAASATEAVVATPSVLAHYSGIAIQDIIPAAAVEVIIAAMGLTPHCSGVTIQDIGICATGEVIVAATGIVTHV